jgi:uncharacterized protein YqcC (DUF446 family)
MEEHTRREALAVVLNRMEAALRAAHEWEDERPAERLLASTQPFSFDTLTFQQWLQWQMIPRMREILGSYAELPESSAILPYAEEFVANGGQGRELLRLIERFDELICA